MGDKGEGGAKNLKKWVTTDVIYEWPPIPLAYHLLYRMVRVRSHEHAYWCEFFSWKIMSLHMHKSDINSANSFSILPR